MSLMDRVISLLPCSDIALEWRGDITTRQKWYHPVHIFFLFFTKFSYRLDSELKIFNVNKLLHWIWGFGVDSILGTPTCFWVYILYTLLSISLGEDLDKINLHARMLGCFSIWPALARFTRSFGPYWEATHHPCMSVNFLKYTLWCPRGIFSQIHPSADIQECISNKIISINFVPWDFPVCVRWWCNQ